MLRGTAERQTCSFSRSLHMDGRFKQLSMEIPSAILLEPDCSMSCPVPGPLAGANVVGKGQAQGGFTNAENGAPVHISPQGDSDGIICAQIMERCSNNGKMPRLRDRSPEHQHLLFYNLVTLLSLISASSYVK